MSRERYVGQARQQHRMAICRKCGKNWVIAAKQEVPESGYLCPHCRYKRKGDKPHEK